MTDGRQYTTEERMTLEDADDAVRSSFLSSRERRKASHNYRRFLALRAMDAVLQVDQPLDDSLQDLGITAYLLKSLVAEARLVEDGTGPALNQRELNAAREIMALEPAQVLQAVN